jgi:hypothetical protein
MKVIEYAIRYYWFFSALILVHLFMVYISTEKKTIDVQEDDFEHKIYLDSADVFKRNVEWLKEFIAESRRERNK